MAEGEELLPGYWSSGYFSLSPSESISVKVSCPLEVLKGKNPKITVSGWNVVPKDLLIN